MKAEIRIVIADDHPIFRQGLRQVIEKDTGITVLAEAGDGDSALDAICRWQPEVALLDIDMPRKDGFQVVRALRDRSVAISPIFLTMYKDETHLNEALNLGVKGYVLKDSAAAEVVSCIKMVVAGHTYISPGLSEYLLRRVRRTTGLAEGQPGLGDLTATERRVLVLLADYKTNKEIAAAIGVSTRTVENHRANVCAKLGLHGAHALAKFAIEHKANLLL
jgi:DNA-binding NarL/FixJ family response regulator